MTVDNLSSTADHQDDGREQLCADVLHGLRKSPKELPCKYFYDERGSKLFEAICELDEYYLTRSELAVMEDHASEMAEFVGTNCLLVEYGSGSSIKTRLLLDRLADRLAAYVPVDISLEHLEQSAKQIALLYPDLEVTPVCADFTQPFTIPQTQHAAVRRVVYFPGSTLGNFDNEEATVLLGRIRDVVGPGGGMLLGLDLKKDIRILERAYNDAQGVTAEFNRNLLARINRELGADFVIDRFDHQAPYNPERGCIEMFLVSTQRQTVRIRGETFSFACGEPVLTERSHKYDLGELAQWAQRIGWKVEKTWTGLEKLFSVQYLRAQSR